MKYIYIYIYFFAIQSIFTFLVNMYYADFNLGGDAITTLTQLSYMSWSNILILVLLIQKKALSFFF